MEVYALIEIKDVKSIKIVPYTLMMSSISAILGLIFGIIIAIALGVTVGSLVPGTTAGMIATLAVGAIIAIPTVMFLVRILESFLMALFYNKLVPRLGAIKLGFEDLKIIKNVPVVPFALMTAALGGIMVFLIMLIIGPLFAFGIQSAAVASAGATDIPGLASLGAFGFIGMIILIVGVPIGMFVSIFISSAIMAFLYNVLAPKIGGIEFNFTNVVGNFFEIESIPVVKFALITTLVLTLFELIVGIVSLIIGVATGTSVITVLIELIVRIVMYLIFGFIIFAVTAFLYNYLRPRIGGIKLEIE